MVHKSASCFHRCGQQSIAHSFRGTCCKLLHHERFGAACADDSLCRCGGRQRRLDYESSNEIKDLKIAVEATGFCWVIPQITPTPASQPVTSSSFNNANCLCDVCCFTTCSQANRFCRLIFKNLPHKHEAPILQASAATEALSYNGSICSWSTGISSRATKAFCTSSSTCFSAAKFLFLRWHSFFISHIFLHSFLRNGPC